MSENIPALSLDGACAVCGSEHPGIAGWSRLKREGAR